MLLFQASTGGVLLAQTTLTLTPSINRIELGFEILDTIKIDEDTRDISVVWLGDTIVINKRDDNYTIDTTQGESYRALMEASAQNCYSYALERYFENDKLYSQQLFNKNVTITGPSLMKIMGRHFRLIQEFSIKDKRDFMRSICDHQLIGLVDQSGRIVHMVFYNKGVFYTKNGMFPPGEFADIRKFLKKDYQYTTQLRVFSFCDK